MKLTDLQKQSVAKWIQEGSNLSDIQKKLATELNIQMTYMDVRFLLIELGFQVQDKKSNRPSPPTNASTPSPAPSPPVDKSAAPSPADPLLPASQIAVTLDRVVKAGALVSGTVTFSDGVSANWALDQLGRLALNATKPGYRPSQEDIQQFQLELRDLLEKRGFG